MGRAASHGVWSKRRQSKRRQRKLKCLYIYLLVTITRLHLIARTLSSHTVERKLCKKYNPIHSTLIVLAEIVEIKFFYEQKTHLS